MNKGKDRVETYEKTDGDFDNGRNAADDSSMQCRNRNECVCAVTVLWNLDHSLQRHNRCAECSDRGTEQGNQCRIVYHDRLEQSEPGILVCGIRGRVCF